MRFLFLIFLLAAGCSAADEQSLDGALAAYSQNRVADAEAILARVIADPAASPADKAGAHRERARIAWLIDGDAARAFAELVRAERIGEAYCDSAVLRARVLRESGQELVAWADGLAEQCEQSGEADSIRLEGAQAALDQAAAGQLTLERSLADADRLLQAAGPDARTGLRGSAIRLQLALAAGEAEAALQSWKDYFWLTDRDLPQGLQAAGASGAALFTAGLAADADAEAQLRLTDLLVRAGFAEAAERFAQRVGLGERARGHPLWRKAAAYFEARREFESTLLESNRRVARGGEAADLDAAWQRLRGRLMAAAGLSGDATPALKQAYGLYGTVGDTGGYASIHLGHVVQDERRTIEQYGHSARVVFLALDNMLANGFESWLWDGSAEAGGWTDPGPVIVQVRTGYTSPPLDGWALFSDAAERRRFEQRAREASTADAGRLRDSDVAYLPGLADRLRLQVVDQVGARARAIAAGGGDLRRAFLDEYWRASYQQSIFLHEGRHALDRTLVTGLARLRDSNLEYRAKLSELALAEYPRLALFNINNITVGDGSPHGEANADVLEAYVEWMAPNRARIAGYDPAVPALAQLDKLSDAQIRAVARGLDPIAR